MRLYNCVPWQRVASIGLLAGLASLYVAPSPLCASSKSTFRNDFSLQVELNAPEDDVLAAVQEVTEDQIIHGTYSFEKEKTLYGAHSADTSNAFGVPPDSGKIFYKVVDRAIAPKNFKETGDVGVLTVRYIVTPVNPGNTSLQIDAIFIDARHTIHPSQGAVESAEYGAVQEHLQARQARRRIEQQEAAEIQRRRDQADAQKSAVPAKVASENASAPSSYSSASSTGSATPVAELEQRVQSLRRQVEMRVKSAGATLKAAPYKSASTLQSLTGDSEVLVVILTPYWYGVETEDGHRGWVHHSQLEPLP
jgi:hypothetical protein